MDATVAFPGTIARRPRAAIGPAFRQCRRTRGLASAIALAAAILAAVAGGVIDSATAERPAGPVPIPLPGLDIVIIIAR